MKAPRFIRRLRRRVRPWLDAVHAYRREVTKPRSEVRLVGRLELLRDFLPWYRSQNRSSLDLARPWITFEAARILEKRMPAEARVFEYGSGGSTLFFARHAAQVVSVEHDPAWFAQVRDAVATFPAVEVLLAEPRPPVSDEEADFASTSPEVAGLTFMDYVIVVDRFPNHSFDILVVDGRARPSAFFRAEPKVRVGGLVVLDDSERPRYRPAVEAAAAAGWVERGGMGPKAFTPYFARTTVWTKTRDLDVARGQEMPGKGKASPAIGGARR